jgi:glyoxylase I family protein
MADFTPPPKNSSSPFADMRGHHVAVRTPSLAEGKDFYVGKLDFRVVAEWDYADEKLAYLAPPTDDHFYIEVLGGGNTLPTEVRPYTDLGDSLKYRGYHHFCLSVASIEQTVAKLRARGRRNHRRAVHLAGHQPQARFLRRPVRQPDRTRRSVTLIIRL